VPIGTSLEDAQTQIRKYGLTLDSRKSEVVYISKGSTRIGETPPMDFVVCEKSDGELKWTVILIMNSQKQVSDVTVTSQTIKK
jgi:hypothetical protein